MRSSYRTTRVTPKQRVSTALFAVVLTVIMGLAPGAPVLAAQDSKGTEFWLMFNSNYTNNPTLSLFITGDVATSGTVSISGLGFAQSFSVTPGAVTTVALPTTAIVSTADGIVSRGIQVVANDEVTVYGLNRIQYTTDAFLGLPEDILGTNYLVMSYQGIVGGSGYGSQLGVVATQDNTSVTIIPSVNTGIHGAGLPFTVVLSRGQVYQLIHPSGAQDLTGTEITSDKPVAVFGSVGCVNIPPGYGACDHIVEQLPPASTWGKSFVTMPLATRTRGDTFRILAGTDGTSVSINGAVVATLNKGQKYERIITGSAIVTASEPVLVAQFSNGSDYDGVTSDPFMMLIPPYEQFLGAYTVTTPATGFNANFINLVAPDASVGNVTLDGSAIPASSFTPIGTSGFSGAQVPVTLGSHNLAGTLPFGAFMYGFASYDSYGYPGGMSLAEVAIVASLELTPQSAVNPVGTQHCIDGEVADQFGAPVPGVRVDYAVVGANPNNGFAFADSNGIARYCYIGQDVGTDVITGTTGNLYDVVTKEWIPGSTLCNVDGDGDIDKNDLSLISKARGKTVPPLDPAYDASGDGVVGPADVKVCIPLCTRSNCATQ